ncbi:hypothetical protein ACFYZN_24305 [Streptomyces sp. NPDC001777]|uniref:hypothetical protein n=1 Tax=Streptomyces sp. NPDC001777 TaxID=3364608 RepID=UPI003697DBC5
MVQDADADGEWSRRADAEPYLEDLDPSGRRAAAQVLPRAEVPPVDPALAPGRLCRACPHAVRLDADAAWMSRHVRSPLIFGELRAGA